MIAKSFERIHRSNLVGMGIIPLCFKQGDDADSLGLTGYERYTIDLPSNISGIRPGQDITVVTDNGKSFTCTLRFDTEVPFCFLNLSLSLSLLCVPFRSPHSLLWKLYVFVRLRLLNYYCYKCTNYKFVIMFHKSDPCIISFLFFLI